VRVSTEISDDGKVLATPRITVALGVEATMELILAGGTRLTYSVKVTATSATCYLTQNLVSEMQGEKKREMRASIVACDGQPTVLELGPKMSSTKRRISITVAPALE
jgi:hypothetical protein